MLPTAVARRPAPPNGRSSVHRTGGIDPLLAFNAPWPVTGTQRDRPITLALLMDIRHEGVSCEGPHLPPAIGISDADAGPAELERRTVSDRDGRHPRGLSRDRLLHHLLAKLAQGITCILLALLTSLLRHRCVRSALAGGSGRPVWRLQYASRLGKSMRSCLMAWRVVVGLGEA